MIAYRPFYCFYGCVYAGPVNCGSINYGKPVLVFVVISSNSNLHGSGRVNQAFLDCTIEHASMVKRIVVSFCVCVRIEMNKRYRAMYFYNLAQYR